MLLTHQNKPSLWGSLLWKDFQQVKLAFLVLVGGALCLQSMFLIISLLTSDHEQSGALLSSVFGIASVTPILLALACSGMLIGHERQSGSWAWSSSLPLSWGKSLCSKLIVATLGSLFASLPLGIIPAIFATVDVVASYYSLTLLIFLQVIVLCFLATILMRETHGALSVAGLVLTVMHFLTSLPWWHENNWITNNLGISSEAAPKFWFLFLSTLILTTGLGLLIAAFRWRWTYGQQSNLAILPVPASTIATGEFRYRLNSGERPSDWWTMFVLSFRNNFAMGLCIVATMTVCMFGFLKTENMLLVMIVLVATLALGVITFQSDQPLGRIRFLADRGIAPWKLVLSRLSISFGFTIPVYFAYLFAMSFHHDPYSIHLASGIILGPVAFSIGALASLCFRKPVVTIGVAVMVAFFGLMVNSWLNLWVTFDRQTLISNYQSYFDFILLGCSPFGAFVYLLALFWLSRRWLVQDKPNLELHFLWISVLALLSPFCIACTFGFLTIPSIPDIPEPVAATWKQPTLPNYLSLTDPLFVDALPDLDNLSRYQSGSWHMITSSAQGSLSTVRNELKANGDRAVSEQVQSSLSKLEAIQNETEVPATMELRKQLESLIARTAALATIALKDMNADLGLRLWKLNRELQDISGEVYPLETQAARKTAMYLLLELESSDIQLMGGPKVYRSLIPKVSDEQSPSLQNSYVRERYYRQQLQSNSSTWPQHWFAVTQYYPPMRWLYERQLASDHRRERTYLALAPKNHITDVVRRELVQRFPE